MKKPQKTRVSLIKYIREIQFKTLKDADLPNTIIMDDNLSDSVNEIKQREVQRYYFLVSP